MSLTSSCFRSVPADSAFERAMKNSTFKVQWSSIQGEPAALTNFHSAGFGEATGLAMSMVLQLYLEKGVKTFMLMLSRHKGMMKNFTHFIVVLLRCRTTRSHVSCCLRVTQLFPIVRSMDVSTFLRRLTVPEFWKGSAADTINKPKMVMPPGNDLITYGC